MTTLPQKEHFRVDEVATYFDVAKSTIYLWIDHGHLKAEKYVGTIRVTRKSILEFKLKQRQRSD
jgi:excisionase family DNA binding protein